MKIIQSFWAKPSFETQENYLNDRKIGGWLNYKYFLLSSAFSCLTLRRFHKKVELYTDSVGFDIYINQLQLPYSNVHLTLNELKNENSKLWILGKILSIKLQSDPFIHVDNDVFIWKRFPSKKSKFLIAQSEGLTPNIYLNTLNDIRVQGNFLPSSLKDWPTMANVGIIGGNDIEFFSCFCQLSNSILSQNRRFIDASNNGYVNQILEEYLFICLAREKNCKVDYLIDIDRNKHPTEQFTRFHLTPFIDKYVHLIGSMKQNLYACEQIEARMKFEFPNYYKSFSNLLKNEYPSLVTDKYNFQSSRFNKLSKVVKKLYSLSISKFLNLKLVLSKDVKIYKETDANNTLRIFILEKNIFSGINQSRELNGLENIMPIFETPCSINEILKQIEMEYEYKYKLEKQNIANLRSNLTDIIAKEVFVKMTLSIASY